MKAARFLRFYWISFLVFPIAFFETSYAGVFEDGQWNWGAAPDFDTTPVKLGVPMKLYVFGMNISKDSYYELQLLAYLSSLVFVIYFTGFCWKLIKQQFRQFQQRRSVVIAK